MPEPAQTEVRATAAHDCGDPGCPCCCGSQATPPVFTVEPFPFDNDLPCFDLTIFEAFVGHINDALGRLEARLTALEATIGKRGP
jgi:hypothetical protein